MAEVADVSRDRISRRQVDKFAQRREQLAASALRTLAELGYAQTSLREIAQNSGFPHYSVPPGMAYAIFDGLFQQSLLRHLAGREGAVGELQANVEYTLDRLLIP